jgi:hypothetical protein
MSRLHEYNAFLDKGIGTTPGEQIKKISWLPALADDRFANDVGITPVSVPSEPPRPGSRLSYSADDLFENDHGINPGMADDLIEQSMTKLAMGRLHGYNTFHDKDIGATPGEQIKKISPSLLFWQGDTSDLLKDNTTLFGSSGSDKFPTRE